MFNVVVVSPRNYFLYTPLLPGVATGAIETRSIVESIRRPIAEKGFKYYEAAATDVDAQKNGGVQTVGDRLAKLLNWRYLQLLKQGYKYKPAEYLPGEQAPLRNLEQAAELAREDEIGTWWRARHHLFRRLCRQRHALD